MTEPVAGTGGRLARRALTPEQRALAIDLAARAERLHAAACGELTVTEAVDVAALEIGHLPTRNASEGEH